MCKFTRMTHPSKGMNKVRSRARVDIGVTAYVHCIRLSLALQINDLPRITYHNDKGIVSMKNFVKYILIFFIVQLWLTFTLFSSSYPLMYNNVSSKTFCITCSYFIVHVFHIFNTVKLRRKKVISTSNFREHSCINYSNFCERRERCKRFCSKTTFLT